MNDLILKLKDDGDYPLDVEATMADLTGDETVMLEEYLGGWANFDVRSGSTRSVIVTIWLAKRQAGKDVSLEEIGRTKGLIFGDAFDMTEVQSDSPPAEAAEAATPSTPDAFATIGHGASENAST